VKKSLLWIVVLLLSTSMIAVFSLAGCKAAVEEEEEAVVVEEEAVVVEEEEAVAAEIPLAFSYDPEIAKTILADAGYVDTDGDGFVEAPDGSTIELLVIVPFGWTDWMESIKIIADGCQAVGINLECEYPDFGGYTSEVYGGTFDMAINNFGSGLSNTVWQLYDWLFRSPIQDQMPNGNFSRYDNAEVFDLVTQLDKVQVGDIDGINAVVSQIQEIHLTDMPAIPLWYNGLWAQVSNVNWTNWPSEAEDTPNTLPCFWGGWLQMGGLMMLTELEPVEGIEPGTGTYPRNETLYSSGTMWGPPSNWNPITPWAVATATVGLCYEPLFLYDPLTDEYTPWLAESGAWTDDDTYELKLREGITWSDGEAFTAEDVKFTFELGQQFSSVYYSTLWDWLTEIVKVDDYTLQFNFSEPLYQEWGNTLYLYGMVPEHLWADRTEDEVSAGANENPVGTGAYLKKAAGADRMIWVKNDNWWATDLLGLEVAPKYIVDIINASNNVSLGMVLKGELDLSNNFLPGVAELVDKGYVETYYAEAPYMLSANTAFLFMNTTKKPMDDPAFRKAVAWAINTDDIVNIAYANLVTASGPTGLLPTLEKYMNY